MASSITHYLASRYKAQGGQYYFAVPGDFNLALLDELITAPDIKAVYCCNELNAGYAADGYARQCGISMLVVTHVVGLFSSINAIAGSYASQLPLIVVDGGINSQDFNNPSILHHSLGNSNRAYVLNMIKEITVHQEIITEPKMATSQIDRAFQYALDHQKPVYIQISCNLARHDIGQVDLNLIQLVQKATTSKHNPILIKAVEAAASLMNDSKNPVTVVGNCIRPYHCIEELVDILKSKSYLFAITPDAKGILPQKLPGDLGIYWGDVEKTLTSNLIEKSDVQLVVGARFTDYTSCGFSLMQSFSNAIKVLEDEVWIKDQVYFGVDPKIFLNLLIKKLDSKLECLQRYQRYAELNSVSETISNRFFSRQTFYDTIEKWLPSGSTVFAETGDSWFNTTDLELKENTQFQIQMMYGSIGWATPAAMGYAFAQSSLDKTKPVVLFTGDGAFQMTAQELSTMIRYEVNVIIFLINNGAYAIESAINDGEYNTIVSWRYHKLIDVFADAGKPAQGYVVDSLESLDDTLQNIQHEKIYPCLVEIKLQAEDVNPKLAHWGKQVGRYNSRTS